MTSAAPTRQPGRPGQAGTRGSALRRLLARPLASYYLVLGSAGLLLLLGLVMVFSASSVYSLTHYGTTYAVFLRQAMWVAVGIPVTWAVARSRPRTARFLGLPLLLASIALIVLTYVPHIGVSVNGNRNWLDFGGPFRLQPSELAKLALVLWGADVYTRKQRLLRQWQHLLVPYVPGAATVIALVIGQGDLGTALVLMGIVLTTLWVVGAPLRLFAVGFLAVAAATTALVLSSSDRIGRFLAFVNPFDPSVYHAAGWQTAHGIYAFATGGWWGAGLGASRQKWGNLPEAHTDFIFAVIGEELGLVGSLVVVLLFLVLGYAGVRIAWRTRDRFVQLAAAGLTGWLLVQAVVNIAAVLGLGPVVGIPLPLVSYGGSALLPMMVAIGLLLSFAREEPGARAALAARPRWWLRVPERPRVGR